MPELESIRLDKWLWTARFYKTRKLAAEAISGGKVHVNGQRSKPGKEVKIGYTLLINKDQFSWDLTITGINSHRRPAKEAVLLYHETPESQEQRHERVLQLKAERSLIEVGKERRPTKKQRRQIHRFKQSQ